MKVRPQYVLTPAMPVFSDPTPVRAEIRQIAARLLALDYKLEQPRTTSDLEQTLRHADLPFALDEFLRQQIQRSAN